MGGIPSKTTPCPSLHLPTSAGLWNQQRLHCEPQDGCKVRSYPDSQAKPLEILSLARLDLLGYGDKDYVQATFPAAPTEFWLESKLRVFHSQQLTC